MRPNNRRGKRQRSLQDQEPEVDDLVVAASFAQVTSFPTKPEPQQVHPQEKESSDSNEEKEDSVEEDNITNNVNVQEEGNSDDLSSSDDDDDDESDVDLSEVLAKMEDDDGPTTASASKGDSQVPKTEHEMDPYRTPISDLEEKFQLNLTVAEQERLRLDNKETAIPSAGRGPVQLCAAGHVKCHMVEDRTIVVESVATGGAAPLDEGSLLVIRIENNEGDAKQKSQLIPLGKVFEVFGPVSRPLYTIRLPSAKDSKLAKRPEKEQKDNKDASVERDADEISLDDDDVPQNDTTGAVADKSVGGVQYDKPAEKNSESDPWTSEGKNTQLLKDTKRLPVYYIPDITKLLDTGAVIRNSGRGSDASNLYDEEVINANEIDFSDDEQEREYKNRNKRGKKGRGRKNDGGPNSGRGRGPSNSSGYTGFHAPQHASYPPAATQPTQYAAPMMYPPMQYQAAPGAYAYSQPYAYPGHGPCPYSQGFVPPPPPPYPHEQSQTQTAHDQRSGGQPGDEASDTVYYD